MVLEKTLESPLDCKDIKPVNTNGTNTKYSLEGAKAKASILWLLDGNSQLTEKDPDEGEA